MKTIPITYAKNHFSSLVKQVRNGASILVSDHGKPVAQLAPVPAITKGVGAAVIRDLEKRGLVRCGAGQLGEDFWKTDPLSTRDGSSVLKALLEEREAGR